MRKIIISLALFIFSLKMNANNIKIDVKPKNLKGFDSIYTSFKRYNPSIDTLSIKNFTNVVNHYELNKDKRVLKYLIGQILLESGGKQYYPERYKKKCGQLVVSPTGAIGFSQILGSTGLDCMVRLLKSDDKREFYQLGAKDFEFAYDKTLTKRQKIVLTKEWLSDEVNNMIMWGFIMKYNLKKRGIINALVSYNVGIGGLNKYIREGNKPYDHEYIRGIRKRLSYINL